jgi:hypothetical protein
MRRTIIIIIIMLNKKVNNSFPFTTMPLATVGLLNTKLGELHDVAGSRFDTDNVLSER